MEVARGLLGVGRVQKKQAMSGLIESAGLEARTMTMNEQLKQQREIAEAQTTGTLTAAGGATGAYLGAKAGAIGGPAGAIIGAAIGFLASKLF